MARKCVAASTQYLSRSSAVVSSTPLTMAGWFRLRAGATAGLCYLDNASTGSNRLGLLGIDGGNLTLQVQDSGGTGNVSTSTTITNETWAHAAAVCTSTTSRAVYLDGAGKNTSVTSVSPTLTDTHLGVLDLGGAFFVLLDGDLAEWAMWNVALTDAEVAALAAGLSPLFIRPTGLVAYWPLLGVASPEIEPFGHADLTLTNTPTSTDHPRILRPVGTLTCSARPYRITGVAKTSGGAAVASATVMLFRTSDKTYIGSTTADGSGNYSFLVVGGVSYFIVAYKAGTPDIAGTTLNTLTGA